MGNRMKALTANDAKCGFGRLLDLVVIAVEEFTRLKALEALATAPALVKKSEGMTMAQGPPRRTSSSNDARPIGNDTTFGYNARFLKTLDTQRSRIDAGGHIKTLLRKAEERTVDGLWRRIGGLLDAFTPRECANYLQNAGYASI
jgi:hypothetical protein